MSLASTLSAALFPRCCTGCGEAQAGAAHIYEWEYLCPGCARQLRGVGDEACQRCGVPVYGQISGVRLCMACREKAPAWNAARSLVRYTGAARTWVRGYKYSDARWVEREWVKLLKAPAYAWLPEWLSGAILVPVPLHPLKHLLRGFNQSETFSLLLVKTLSPTNTEINTRLLRRTRWTRQQARLRRDDRLKNVVNAFAINPKTDLSPYLNRRIILIDDLLTTGATLTVCANALKKAGFRHVDVFTIARG